MLTRLRRCARSCRHFRGAASAGTINGCAPRFVYPDAAFSRPATADPNADLLTAATPTTVHEDTWLVRIDHKFNEKTLLYGRAQRDISLVNAPNGSSLPADKLQTINHPANYLLALAAHLHAESLQRGQVLHQSLALPQSPGERASICGQHQHDFVGLNDNTADIEVGTTYRVVDNLTWTHGRHAFKTAWRSAASGSIKGKPPTTFLTFASEA